MTGIPRRSTILVATVVVAVLAAACGSEPVLDIRGADADPSAAPAARDAAEVPASPSTSPEDVRPRTPQTADRGDRTATPEPGSSSESPSVSSSASSPTAELTRGDRGSQVRAVQRRLVELGYWLGEADGEFGHLTRQAVLAFQGWEGLTRDGVVGPRTRRALQEAGRPQPARGGDLVEIHRDRGLLLIVRDGRTRLALHTSTGTGEPYTQPDGDRAVADTPAGTWEISWQVDGWRESDLGRLWRPKYFHEDGLAIHGHPDVPARRASHGCARVSMEAMDMIWRRGFAPTGTTVVVR